MKYPTWKPKSSPTPNDTLFVCDACEKAEWSIVVVGHARHCQCGRRMRKATADETEAGKKALGDKV